MKKLCVEKSLNSSATDKERISPRKEDRCGAVFTEMLLESLAAFQNLSFLQVSDVWEM